MDGFYGAIEAGGTKFICGVGSGPDDLQVTEFKTTTPDQTIDNALSFFRKHNSGTKLEAIGIGSFGPVDLDKGSPTYGFITDTPKPGWPNTDFIGPIKDAFDIPIGFDTDTNAAALGEQRWGAAAGLSDFIYLTIGTGVGGGGLYNGKLMHGLVHPEMGHIFLPRDPGDTYKGKCPFHGNRCFEGLASGPAIGDRWGVPAEELGYNHQAWDLEAGYISLALVNFICTLSPRRIILGGGVMEQKQLFPMIHKKAETMINGYIRSEHITNDISNYIVPPVLGKRTGVLGGLALAMSAAARR